MSLLLTKFINSYIDGRVSTQTFVDAYIELWRIERDMGILPQDEPLLSEVLSSVFCIVDLYNPEVDRENYEFDDDAL